MRCKDVQLQWARTSLINFPWSEVPGEFFIYGQKPFQYVRRSYKEILIIITINIIIIIIIIITIIVYIANLLVRSAKIFVYNRLKRVSHFLFGVLLNIAMNSACIASV